MLGDSPEDCPDYSRIINEFHTERIERLISTAGGKIVCGGTVDKEKKYVAPTIILSPNQEAEIMQEEIFGPVLPVYAYKDLSEAINFINSKEKPLTVYYFGKTGSPNERRVLNETASGSFVTNDMLSQFGSNYLGFGGVGKSGYGRHGGFEGYKNFCNRKGILLKKPAPAFVVKMTAPPFDEAKKKQVLSSLKGSMQTNQDQLGSFCTGICSVILNVVLAYFFFAYAFASPDGSSCFATADGAIAATYEETKTMEGRFFEVSRAFELWFRTGFVLCCCTLAYYTLSYLNYKCGRSNLINQVITGIGYLSVLGTLVWTIAGTMLRRSEEAKVCSGDLATDDGQAPYQWKSGKFMKLYIWAMYGVIGLTVLYSLITAMSDACSTSYRRCHAHVK